MPVALLALLKDPRILLALAGGLGNFLFRDKSVQERQRAIMRALSPETIAKNSGLFAELLKGSPIFSQAQRDIAAGSNTGITEANRSLAERGLTGSGLGAMLTQGANSAAGFQMGQLNASVLEQALKAAMSQSQQTAGALSGLPIQPSASSSLFGNFLGALSLSLPKNQVRAPQGEDASYGGFRLPDFSRFRQTSGGAPGYYDVLRGGLP